jgi:putative ABC transport system permease protein
MLKNYLKTAMAVFKRRKFFTFVSLLGITFTLAVLMVAAAITENIFGEFPPEVHQSRTLGIYFAILTGERGTSASGLSFSVLDRTVRNLPGAERSSIFSTPSQVTSFVEERRIVSYLKHTDAAYWEILRFEFLEGRPYTMDEVTSGARVAVINRATRERFFGSQSAVGKLLEAAGKRYRVVGVVENVPFFRLVPFADLWVPITTEAGYDNPNRVLGAYMATILASSRVEFPGIHDEFLSRLETIDLSVEGDYDKLWAVPESIFDTSARVLFAQGQTTEKKTPWLLSLIVLLMVLFMILPAVNLVNLNISRIMDRASEIGVRKAFGAPSLTLVGQFIVENVVLTLSGGALALVAVWFLLDAISASGVIPYAEFDLNLKVFFYSLLIALVFGFVSGAYPAWRMSRLHPVDALRGGAR